MVLKPGEPGVLWAFWRIHSLKATGVLTVQWEKFKKQIAFRAGEAVASKSNWPHETLGSYLVRRKKVEASSLQAALQEASKNQRPLGEQLVMNALIPSHELGELLESHFRERIFNSVALSHGELEFATLDELSLKDTDQMKLSGEFLRLLWDAARLHLDLGACRSRLSILGSKPIQARGDFPFPISPKELRFWNGAAKEFTQVQGSDIDALRLFAVALEFDLLSKGAAPDEKIRKDLESLTEKFKTAKAFQILNVAEDATEDVCKRAYLDLVKKYHPDRLPPDSDPVLKRLGEELFAKINEAHSTMTDPEKRDEYNALLQIEKSGGIEQIEKTLEAEMLIPQAKMALKRRHYKAAHDQLVTVMAAIKNDGELIADFAFAKLMQLIDAKVPIKEQLKEFHSEIKKALALRPKYGAAYYYRGMAYKLDNQMEKAVEDFDEAVQFDSSLAEAASEARLIRSRKDKKSK